MNASTHAFDACGTAKKRKGMAAAEEAAMLLSVPWVVQKTWCDGIGNVIKGYVSALSVNPASVVECNPLYTLGLYDTVLDPSHVYVEGGPRLDFYTCRLLVLREEEGSQPLIPNEFAGACTTGNPWLDRFYSTTKCIDWNYDSQRLAPRVRERIDRIFASLRFLPFVTERVQRVTRCLEGRRSLGISVRTWRAPHERNIDRPYDFEVYRRAILGMLPHVSWVLLSVDCEEETPRYLQMLQGVPVTVLAQPEDENATQHAFVKVLSLARCDYLVASRLSTFVELAWWFSGRRVVVVPVH
jgi:hypothetical protein